MDINAIQQMNSVMKPHQTQASNQSTPHEAQQSFKTWMNNAISEVNDAQVHSADMTEKMARGEQVDLHDVMIASEKASVTLQTTIEVRNKAIEAYQEIMRMQV
ncbi:flagellar hook-basal body complex protein FliE [Salipaludibacillus keqinensis]|uniref:Flagellar hook-basal body complex protein FliE n=1 Tax=Salipaludibacillus keqinensis TaxID=2045207 RepID=A0A323TEW7_9BACI|nr:flagellar hook-basal body complex protein FliE [Salipaludibacillus keqinensis]PYZ93150.1 flagellar hook-basal body complex protein FliE [Salipaludibacillus keqinensis]